MANLHATEIFGGIIFRKMQNIWSGVYYEKIIYFIIDDFFCDFLYFT